MPSRTKTTTAPVRERPAPTIDDYFDDDPFASDTDGEHGGDKTSSSKKRKELDAGLGIDEEVQVKKRARAPRVKLDETRLLSEKGIPTLRRTAKKLKFKGKGHEFSDAARLLSFYQLWLDDLFPKAKFLDALAMVEKAGHGKNMAVLRKLWIEEGKPKTSVENDEDEPMFAQSVVQTDGGKEAEPTRLAPVFEMATEAAAARNRQKTPERDIDPFASDEDIYNATPRRSAAAAPKAVAVDDDVPDDLDALMAEAEAETQQPVRSLFGGSLFGPMQPSGNVPDDNDLEALMAEAEAQEPQRSNGSPKAARPAKTTSFGGEPAEKRGDRVDDGGDLNALIAEAEDTVTAAKAPPAVALEESADRSSAGNAIGVEDEEAMAEMEGLW